MSGVALIQRNGVTLAEAGDHGASPAHPYSRPGALAIFQRGPLLSAPGARYSYSSPGYVLLTWIVQQTAGQPYASFLADRVFGPHGLDSASAGDPPGGPAMARGYRAGEPVPSVDLATVSIGAGDIWCSAPDLLRWDAAIANDELLPASLRTVMLTAHTTIGSASDGESDWTYGGYGYGWRIGTVSGRRVYYHAGDNPGYLSLNAWLPDSRVTLAVLANDESAAVLQVAAELLELAG